MTSRGTLRGSLSTGLISTSHVSPATIFTSAHRLPCRRRKPCHWENTGADNLVVPNNVVFPSGNAYITNRNANSVTRCMVNASTGDLGPGCDKSTYFTLNGPRGIIFPPTGVAWAWIGGGCNKETGTETKTLRVLFPFSFFDVIFGLVPISTLSSFAPFCVVRYAGTIVTCVESKLKGGVEALVETRSQMERETCRVCVCVRLLLAMDANTHIKR